MYGSAIRTTNLTWTLGVRNGSILLVLFRAQKPEHMLVAQKANELQTLRGRWQGVYVVIYKDGLPEEISFAGYSGDQA